MKVLHPAFAFALGIAASTAVPAMAQAPAGFVYLAPEKVPFKSPLGVGPQQAVIFGDPSKPGVYVTRVHFPPGFHSNPHFHSQDRHATVIKGVWWNGTGEELDFNKARPVTAGSYVLHPAGAVHWDGAGDEETIVQIVGVGPVETTPVGKPEPGRDDHWPKPK
jgi:quercetin dioxygenase-like cupin family protein